MPPKFDSMREFFFLFLGFSYLQAVLASPYSNRTIAGPFFTPVSRTQERLDMYIKADNMMTRITTQPLCLSEMHYVIALLCASRAHLVETAKRNHNPDVQLILAVNHVRRLDMVDTETYRWMEIASYQPMYALQDIDLKRLTNRWIMTIQRHLNRDMTQSNTDASIFIETWSSKRLMVLHKLGIFFHNTSVTDRLSLLLERVDNALCEWRNWQRQGESCSEEDDEEDSQTTPLYSTRFQRPAFLSRLRAYLRRRGEKVVVSS